VNGHGSEGATALFDMAGFVIVAHVVEAGEWWLLIGTTADRVCRAGCGVRAVASGTIHEGSVDQRATRSGP
jgi:hypothetical protein